MEAGRNQWTIKHVLFLLIWSGAFISISKAQVLRELRFESYDEEKGMSSHWVTGIALDSNGYVWVGTYDGLNRFDGYSFKTFRHHDKVANSLLHDNGQTIYVASNGDVWIAYSEGGFSRYHPGCGCFSHYKTGSSFLLENPDRDFAIRHIDQKGQIWFSGEGLGLNKLDPEAKTVTHFELPNLKEKISESDKRYYNTVYYIHESPEGLFWLCTENGLYSFRPGSNTFSYKVYNGPRQAQRKHEHFAKLIPEGDVGFWLASWDGGLSYFDIATERFSNYNFETKKIGYYNLINDIARKNEHEIWISSGDKGLGIFDTRTRQFNFYETIRTVEGKPISFPGEILLTRNQELFLADENGLNKFNPYSTMFEFRRLLITESQHDDLFAIRKIIENPTRNEIYFATELGNGLNILNTKTGALRALHIECKAGSDQKHRITNLVFGKGGSMWLISRDYLYRFDEKQQKLYRVNNPFEDDAEETINTFKNFVSDKDSNLWVLTHEGGLFPFDSRSGAIGKRINAGTDQQPVRTIESAVIDSEGNTWIFGDTILGIIKKESGETRFVQDSLLAEWLQKGITGMCEDSRRNVWLSVRNRGLLRFRHLQGHRVSYEIFTRETGLPGDRIIRLGIDHRDHLWMATYSGVIYMDPDTKKYRVFNQSVGMDMFTVGMRFIKSNNDAFYLVTPGKYCKIDYGKIDRDLPLPKVYLDQFKVFNKEKPTVYDAQHPLVLKAGEDFFSFDFSCIDFTNQAQHRFAYMLEGWDKEWIQSGSRRYASYMNLDEGHYTFKVKAANMEGAWGNVLSIPLEIETYFYRKTWFSVFAVWMVAALIYLLYRYRIKQIRRTEGLKTAFNKQLAETRLAALRAQMNPHFIFNCLNSINRYIIKSDIKTSSLYLTRFARLIRLILDNSEKKMVPLSTELETLHLYIEMEALRFDQKFTWECRVDQEIDTHFIGVPPLIIQPFVENAIWHGLMPLEKGGHLKIEISQEEDHLVVEVEDNGIGRKRSAELKNERSGLRTSKGMKLTEERLNYDPEFNHEKNPTEIIDLYDENQQACGTRVVIKIPI